MMTINAIVFGPDISHTVSGHGWVKYNIILALINSGKYDNVVSVSKGKKDIPLQLIPSSEDRSWDDVNRVKIGPHLQQITISNEIAWENFVETIRPDIIITVGDVSSGWFVPLFPNPEISPWYKKVKKIYYFITEGRFTSRYIPIVGPVTNDQVAYLDISKVLAAYNEVIPATSVTAEAITKDMKFIGLKDQTAITPPVWKWNINKEKSWAYRDTINTEYDSLIHFCIARNNIRKRLDQVLLFYRKNLLKKPCCRLVIHTDLRTDGYDIVAIANRLGMAGNIIVNTDMSQQAMEGIFSAGDVFVNLPAAEGYGLPLHEALLLGKPVIHSEVGYFAREALTLKGCDINLIEARHEYFAPSTDEPWYAIGNSPREKKVGRIGSYTIEQAVNTPDDFQSLLIKRIYSE